MIDLRVGDSLELLKSVPDNSVDLILTDPPYFKVKANAWDNQWKKADDFIQWMGLILDQFVRVLKHAGSLYLFASPQMASRVETAIAERLDVLNHVVWRKESGRHKGTCVPALRKYFPQTERIIFAEHRGPRRKLAAVRRHFGVSRDVPYTDVWDFPVVQHYKGKHPCEKPHSLLRHMIVSSSRPGDTVLDAFAGSGSTGAACVRTGRHFVGMELDPETAAGAQKRMDDAQLLCAAR